MNPYGFVYPDPLPCGVKGANARAMMLVARYLNADADFPRGDDVREMIAAVGGSEDDAYARLFGEGMGLSTAGADRSFYERYVKRMFTGMDTMLFRGDRYFRTVKFPEATHGKFSFRHLTLPAYRAFPSGDVHVKEDGRLLPALGYFREDYVYPAVLENGREWMTLLPVEILTMKAPIRASRGRVLTYGLGLGYFAFHASEKDEVESVTVVEQSEDAIALFRDFLLPQFPHREKICIVKDDAFRFAEHEVSADRFDYVFADIWHDAGDGIPAYVRLLKAQKDVDRVRYDYWLEDTLLAYLDAGLWPDDPVDNGGQI